MPLPDLASAPAIPRPCAIPVPFSRASEARRTMVCRQGRSLVAEATANLAAPQAGRFLPDCRCRHSARVPFRHDCGPSGQGWRKEAHSDAAFARNLGRKILGRFGSAGRILLREQTGNEKTAEIRGASAPNRALSVPLPSEVFPYVPPHTSSAVSTTSLSFAI